MSWSSINEEAADEAIVLRGLPVTGPRSYGRFARTGRVLTFTAIVVIICKKHDFFTSGHAGATTANSVKARRRRIGLSRITDICEEETNLPG